MYNYGADPSLSAVQRIKVVGVGDGGCNTVDHMYREWSNGPELVAVNTDAQSLQSREVPTKIQIGSNVARGLGAGGDPKVGRLAVEEDRDLCRATFEGVDIAFFVVGLGGGTGTGALPEMIDAAHRAGALTLVFATLPFGFEGQERMQHARKGLELTRSMADSVVLVPNERLYELVEEGASIADAFRHTNRIVSQAIMSLWMMVTRQGLINLDYSDLRKVVRLSGGTCVFGVGFGVGSRRTQAAVESILSSPLLIHGQLLADSAGLLVSIVGGPDLRLQEVDSIMSAISAKAGANTHIAMGAIIDERWHDRVLISVMASEEWQGGADAGEPKRRDTALVKKDGATVLDSGVAAEQTSMAFDTFGRGRFKDVEPTMIDGEDLDIPTFVRRGIPIEK